MNIKTYVYNHRLILILTFFAICLRFYQLGHNPPSLNLDEVAIGYNSYSILHTLRDEYGTLLPIAFRSHDDYKAPFYIYATVIPVALFGLNEFAVRFISALFGSLTVPLVYLLGQAVFFKHQHSRQYSLLASFLVCISPWHLQFSRAGFETTVAVFWLVLGTWAFLKGKLQPNYWFLTAFAFALSLYTYHSNKLFVPLFSLFLITNSYRIIVTNLKKSLFVAVVFLILIFPLIPFMLSPQGQLRFKGTSIFETPTLIDINHHQKIDQWRLGRRFEAFIFHDERLSAVMVILKGYFSHWTYDFLFHGESGPPKNHTPNVGLLYIWELPFLIFGFYSLYKNRLPHRHLIIVWMLLAPLASSLTWDVPSSTRTTIIIPTLQLIIAVGTIHALSLPRTFSGQIILTTTFSLFGLFFFAHYLHNYYRIAPVLNSDAWQYGYKQAVIASQNYLDRVDTVVVSTKLKQPQNFFAFYTRYDPATYINIDGGTVSGGFQETRNHFGKYYFQPITWDERFLQPRTLYIDLLQFPDKRFVPIHTINLLDGTPTIGLFIF